MMMMMMITMTGSTVDKAEKQLGAADSRSSGINPTQMSTSLFSCSVTRPAEIKLLQLFSLGSQETLFLKKSHF